LNSSNAVEVCGAKTRQLFSSCAEHATTYYITTRIAAYKINSLWTGATPTCGVHADRRSLKKIARESEWVSASGRCLCYLNSFGRRCSARTSLDGHRPAVGRKFRAPQTACYRVGGGEHILSAIGGGGTFDVFICPSAIIGRHA